MSNTPLQQPAALVTAAAIGEDDSNALGSRRAKPARVKR